MSTVGVVASAAGGLECLTTGLVQPLVAGGHRVAVTLTPTARSWLTDGEMTVLEDLSGLPVRWLPRLPAEPGPHPKLDVLVAAPLTANSVAKLALGIADNQALTLLCESLTVLPVVVFPRVNAAHARHPAWDGHLARLRSTGVHLVYGEDVWPLAEPRTAPGDRALPWTRIIQLVDCVGTRSETRASGVPRPPQEPLG